MMSYSQQQIKKVSATAETTTLETTYRCGTPAKTEAQMRYTLDVVDKMVTTRNTGTTGSPIRVHIVRMDGGTGGISMDDLNIDGDFEDAGELLYTSSAAGSSISGSITLPATGSNGLTTLRVR
ncbi:MAG: hypothetical protein ACI9VN_000935 [Patescibacteria group bacterium]|jgi:hypothetical protein